MNEREPIRLQKITDDKRAMARALVQIGKTYREVAEELGISVGSVHNILKESEDDITRLLGGIRKRYIAKHYMLSDHILGRITDSDIGKASLVQKVKAATMLTGKARQLEGLSENNAAQEEITVEGAARPHHEKEGLLQAEVEQVEQEGEQNTENSGS